MAVLHLSFSRKLFLTVISLFWIFAAYFIFYQYQREKEFKIELFNDRLAIFNAHLNEAVWRHPDMAYSVLVDSFVQVSEIEHLRVTLIRPDGKILYDNRNVVGVMMNHAQREEVRQALQKGSGYTINRHSATMKGSYFYYATFFPDTHLVIRCALPYDIDVMERLKADMNYLWGVVVLTCLLTLIFYHLTRQLGKTITQLRLFAKKADMDEPFRLDPQQTGDNELDMIARHIIDMFYRLRRTKDELLLAREKLIAHLQNSNQGLAVFSPRREMILSNPLFAQYLRIISDQEIKDFQHLCALPDFHSLKDFIDASCKCLPLAEAKSMRMTVDKNGSVFSVMIVVFQDASFEVAVSDITQQEEQARIKRQITQNMAHELKTPVSSIQGYLETLIQNPDIKKEIYDQFLQRSLAQSERLTNLLRDITALTRMDEASSMIEVAEEDLAQIVRHVASDLYLALQEKKMQLHCLIPEKMPIRGNASLLYSIFRNLADNALAYAGAEKEIWIECYREDDACYYFSVRDNGPGVPPVHLGRLFERFYRVDKGRSRKIGGTGLGLAIVKNAVLFHGGTISAKQAACGGLELIFMLRKKTDRSAL